MANPLKVQALLRQKNLHLPPALIYPVSSRPRLSSILQAAATPNGNNYSVRSTRACEGTNFRVREVSGVID